jgi:hypothetical protein
VPITYTPLPEPLAGPPGGETGSPQIVVTAETQAQNRLLTIIRRYCGREIAGRSILIAGHRGAGKTTLLKAVIEFLRRDPSLTGSTIPLYVQIHGPDLLGGATVLGMQADSAAGGVIGTATSGDKGQAAAQDASTVNASAPSGGSVSKQRDEDEVEQALTSLRVLTIALHRAFVTDLGWSFECSVSPQQLETKDRPNKRNSDNLQELAAQLRLDFDDLVETDGLRWIWKRAGLLYKGVLRPKAPAERIAAQYFSQQGLLEIVAATCVSDSYARSVAKIDDSEKSKADAEFKQAHEMEKLAERKELTHAVAGILAGGVAGGGAALAHNGPLAGLLFIVSSVLTTALLNYTSTRSRTRTRSREKNIQWDRSVASLDLMLPLSIARVLDAGRAPIFVIDELDKVNEIEKKLERLINRLKHIVADRALFCFLVDRSYFERIQTISRVAPQRKEHTFFSERLYVIATPAQWRDYLQRLLAPGDSNSDRLQLLALTYVLLARSKMHAIDLRREVEALTRARSSPGAPGVLDLPDLIGPMLYRNMIYMQAVVEFVLEEDVVKRRLQRDPGFAQSMYDALYYLLRQWEQDELPDVTPVQVRAYLESRMRAEESRASGQDRNANLLAEERNGDSASYLSDVDFEGLYSVILQAANLLCDSGSLKASIRDKVTKKTFSVEWGDLVDMIPDSAILQRVGDEFHWLFDINATPLKIPEVRADATAKPALLQPAPVLQDPVAATLADIAEVEQVNEAVRQFTEERLTLEQFGTELRLLPLSPTYRSFEVSTSQYRANAGAGPVEQTYPSLTSDKTLIQSYAATVRASLKAIQRLIFLAELLAQERQLYSTPGNSSASPGSLLRSEMLRSLAKNLDFARLAMNQIDAMLREMGSEFAEGDETIRDLYAEIGADNSLSLDRNWPSAFGERLGRYFTQAVPFVGRGTVDWLDNYVRGRTQAILLHLRNRQDLKRLSLGDLRVLASLRDVPAIHGDPDNMSMLDYADALTFTRKYPPIDGVALSLALLIKLGFGKQVGTVVLQHNIQLGSAVSDLFEAARLNERTGERVLLVIGGAPDSRVSLGAIDLVDMRKGEGSYAANWTISPTHAVYPVHIGDVDNLLFSALPNGGPLVLSLELTVEIHDLDVMTGVAMPEIPSFKLPGPPAARLTLDDAIAAAKAPRNSQ